MAKYKKKPIVIEAVKWTGENPVEIINFKKGLPVDFRDNNEILIETLEGNMIAKAGDWIIKDIKGEYYPCKPDIFEATYELVIENKGIYANLDKLI